MMAKNTYTCIIVDWKLSKLFSVTKMPCVLRFHVPWKLRCLFKCHCIFLCSSNNHIIIIMFYLFYLCLFRISFSFSRIHFQSFVPGHVSTVSASKIRHWIYFRADSRFAHIQWEAALLCNHASHWLGASLESTLYFSVYESVSTVK